MAEFGKNISYAKSDCIQISPNQSALLYLQVSLDYMFWLNIKLLNHLDPYKLIN